MKTPQLRRRSLDSTGEDRVGLNHKPNGRVGALVHVGNEGIVKRPWTDSESTDGSCYETVDGCLIPIFNDTNATGRAKTTQPSQQRDEGSDSVIELKKGHQNVDRLAVRMQVQESSSDELKEGQSVVELHAVNERVQASSSDEIDNSQPTVEPLAVNQRVEDPTPNENKVGEHDVESSSVDEQVQAASFDQLRLSELDLDPLPLGERVRGSDFDQLGLGELDLELFVAEIEAYFARIEEEGRHGVQPLGGGTPSSSATSNAEADAREGVNEHDTANAPERSSAQEKRMVARLLEIESVTVREDSGELEGGQAGADGWPSWEWIRMFVVVLLVAINICTTVLMDIGTVNGSRPPSVTTPNTTTTTTTVRTTTGLLPFSRAMNSLVERTGAMAAHLTSTHASGDSEATIDIAAEGDDTKNKIKNKDEGKDKGSNKTIDTNKSVHKGKNSNSNKVRNKDKNKDMDKNVDGATSYDGAGAENKRTRQSPKSSPQRGQPKGRLRKLWAALAEEFEEMVDGPWV